MGLTQKVYINFFEKFIKCQMEKINRDKWCEGFSINKDPGEEYVNDWILKNASWFRKAWDESDCKDCRKWKECGFLVEKNCSHFFTNDEKT